jgi:hypothetical protein
MKQVLLGLAGAVALSGALAATPAQASAMSNNDAVFSVTNCTNGTLYYSIRWGEDGQWQQMALAPGASMEHFWRYDYPDEDRSPTPYIRFDADLTAGTNWVQYGLEAYAAPSPSYEYSKKYVFQYYGDQAVDLVGVN